MISWLSSSVPCGRQSDMQRVKENEKRRKVRGTTDTREILQKTLAAHQESVRDVREGLSSTVV